MKRNAKIADTLPDSVRIAAGLPIGLEGAYFVGGSGFCGQDRDASILEYNDPPAGQPGLWCQWVPNQKDKETWTRSEDGTEIGWNGAEKFYCYIEWLQYIIDHFLKPWGYVLNGEVEWQGERRDDTGLIVVNDNVVTKKVGRAVYKTEEEWSAEDDKVARDNETVQLTEKGKKEVAARHRKASKKKVTTKKPAKKSPKKIIKKPAKKIA